MDLANELEQYFDRLWPICRSITGAGVRKSLEILKEIIPFQTEEVPTGTKIFDWEVPREWVIRDAFLENENGERILDFRENNLHVLGYSQPIDVWLDLQDLKPHLHSLPDLPNAIPYLTSYYEPRWGFCLSHNSLKDLKPGRYRARIDSEHIAGSMTLADCVLKGETEEEILFSTYLCHPSLANNELSGPLVQAFLYKALSEKKRRRFTYRFTLVPETIGTIAYLSIHGQEIMKRNRGGLVVSCMGNDHPYFYQVKTLQGNELIDRAVEHVIEHSEIGLRSIAYHPLPVSDLRHYSSPGFRMPIGALTRTIFSYGELFGAESEDIYEVYHSSLDNKEQMDFQAMVRSISILSEICEALEMNRTYFRNEPHCEPQLSRRNLYPSLSERVFNQDWKWVEQICWLLNFCDGKTDLLNIAQRAGFPIAQLDSVAQKLVEKRLLDLKE